MEVILRLREWTNKLVSYDPVLTRAQEAGFEAYQTGQFCPLYEDDRQSAAWLDGWNEAKDFAEQAW